MTFLLIAAAIALLIQSFLLFLFFFAPYLPYRIRRRPAASVESEEFLTQLEALANAQVYHDSKIDVLTNGENYYEAELEAIRNARSSVNLEAYIFQKGKIASKFVEALTERARAGVKVNLVLDAIGSFATWSSYLKDLRNAGGRIEWYHGFVWYMLPQFNNRTHRELIIVDGKVGFIGGSGIADHWLYPHKNKQRWRDTMFRVEGEIVHSVQAAFAENWLEASGEILVGSRYFPKLESVGGHSVAMIVPSAPSAGRSTRARVIYQTLLATAKESIYITIPYFLPDRSARKEMIRAVQERHVDLAVITPGRQSDHLLTRRSSRRLYGDLLKAGARIFEYEPAMIHTKSMIIDNVWSVVGSTNFDHRSFGLNDEVNLVAYDREFAARVYSDFAKDLVNSRQVSYAEWRRRPILERVHEWFGWVLERQQ